MIKRMRFQWGLRTVLLCMLVFTLLFNWIGRRQRLVSKCEEAGWRVCFEFEFDEDGSRIMTVDRTNNSVIVPSPQGPEFLRERIGLAFFNRLRGVHAKLNSDSDHRLFAQLTSQPSITFIRIDAGTLQWRDVKAIETLPNLRSLHVSVAEMTADQIRSLKAMHPESKLYIRRMEPPP